jgi:hypothetical protein
LLTKANLKTGESKLAFEIALVEATCVRCARDVDFHNHENICIRLRQGCHPEHTIELRENLDRIERYTAVALAKDYHNHIITNVPLAFHLQFLACRGMASGTCWGSLGEKGISVQT